MMSVDKKKGGRGGVRRIIEMAAKTSSLYHRINRILQQEPYGQSVYFGCSRYHDLLNHRPFLIHVELCQNFVHYYIYMTWNMCLFISMPVPLGGCFGAWFQIPNYQTKNITFVHFSFTIEHTIDDITTVYLTLINKANCQRKDDINQFIRVAEGHGRGVFH